MQITVIIYTYNEAENIVDCINSAKKLTNLIIVVDMNSTDKTKQLAEKAGAIIFSYPYSSYVEPAREFGVKKALSNWVFLLDADERMTKELADEINIVISNRYSVISDNKKLKTDNRQPITAFKIPRKNIFGNFKWLKHGGWWPDYQIRLLNKSYFKSWPKEIHSSPIIAGNLGYLNNHILHFFHGDFESMVNKTIVFEDIESELLFKANKNVYTFTFFRKFLGELYRRLIRRIGFLDGEVGIIESIYQAFSKTITYLYLYEKQVRLVEKKLKSRSIRSIS